MTNDEILLLKEELDRMKNAGKILEQSFKKCQKFGVKAVYSNDELESIEAFTSRFARVSDLLIQRIFRLIDEFDLDAEGSVRDRINRAEKKELIVSADAFVEIRKLRNAIAHEYQPDAPEKIFDEVLEYSPVLMDSIERVMRYAKRYEIGVGD
jgi:hypothetical protein